MPTPSASAPKITAPLPTSSDIPFSEEKVGLSSCKVGEPSNAIVRVGANFWIVTFANEPSLHPNGWYNSGRGYTTQKDAAIWCVTEPKWTVQGYNVPAPEATIKTLIETMNAHRDWFGLWETKKGCKDEGIPEGMTMNLRWRYGDYQWGRQAISAGEKKLIE